MKNLFTIVFVLISFHFLYSQPLTLGTAMNETAPGIYESTTQIAVTSSQRYCRVIPQENASYTIRSIGSSDGVCYLYDSGYNLLASGDDEDGAQFVINYALTANQTYYLGILDAGTRVPFTLSITGGALLLPLNVTMDITAPKVIQSLTQIAITSSQRYCRIIPQENALYTIRSIGSSDGVCYLYDSGYNLLASGDDEDGAQFVINYALTANQTYYLGILDAGTRVPFTLSITGGILPVEITSFESKFMNDCVSLNWHTATEVNSYGFEVERAVVISNQLLVTSAMRGPSGIGEQSTSGGNPQSEIDNQKWENIGFVQGSGNSNSPKEYSFIDKNPPSGNLQYRLKQIDTDGKFEYYATVVEVNLNLTDVKEKQLPTEFTLAQNYPNPFNPSTTISYSIPEDMYVTLKIYNILGKEITSLVDGVKESGNYKVLFDAKDIPNGVYLYQLTAGKNNIIKKMVVLK